MEQFHNRHPFERCYILGNGPSLNDVNLDALEHPVFGTNRVYLKDGFVPDYYVCVNPLVLDQFGEEIAALDTVKFLSTTNGVTIKNEAGVVIPLDTSLRVPSFGNPEGPIWEGYTVTYVALQLAFYMGFEEVILLGVDHWYGKPYQPNIEVLATDDNDAGHFSPEYFGKGVRWHAPDLVQSELAYSLANAHYQKNGRRIINCTTTTRLKVFPLASFNQIRLAPETRVSAIVSAYKAEGFIEGCLKDLHNQDERPEIVVVCQEGSPEHKIASEFDDPHITLVTTSDIPTVYEAWNLGIKAASGKYITNANTDDRHHPKAYEIMADILDTRPEIDLVYHNCFITWTPNQTYQEFWDENEDKELVAGRYEGKPGIFNWETYTRRKLNEGCFIGPQPMWRANLHQKHGLFEGKYRSAGDYEFWLRIAKEDNIFHIPYPFGLYCARPDGIELGQPAVSYEETTGVIATKMTHGMDVRFQGEETFRIDLGNEYIFVDGPKFVETFRGLVDQHVLKKVADA